MCVMSQLCGPHVAKHLSHTALEKHIDCVIIGVGDV